MMAPVIFYMFLNSFGTLVVGNSFITTLVFKEPVGVVHHGLSKSELFVQRSMDGKMLFLKALGVQVNTNLNVPTKSGKLYSFRIKSGKTPHSIVQVLDGRRDTLYKNSFTKEKIEIEEGKNSLRLTNHRKNLIQVNSIEVSPKERIFLPKGPSIFINNERFYQ